MKNLCRNCKNGDNFYYLISNLSFNKRVRWVYFLGKDKEEAKKKLDFAARSCPKIEEVSLSKLALSYKYYRKMMPTHEYSLCSSTHRLEDEAIENFEKHFLEYEKARI